MSPTRISHTTVIDAPIDTVWALTLDVSRWPSMSRTFSRIQPLDGADLHPGSRVLIKQPGQPAKVWTVTTVEAPRAFAWRARLFGMPVQAAHALSDDGERTVNELSVELTGRGSGIVGRLLRPLLRRSMITENDGLKRAAEQS